MKKILALIMTLCLLLTMLVGCGSDTTDSTAATTEPTTEASNDPSGIKGTINGNVYTNTKAGFGLSLSDDWYVYNEEEIASIMGFTADMFSDEEVKNLVESSGAATVFYASATSGSNINVNWENLGLSGILMNADSYIDSALTNLEPTLASAGFTNLVFEKSIVPFAGEDRPAIVLSAELNGVSVYEILVPIVTGTYVCNTTICTVNTNTCADLLASFYAVD